MAKKHTFELKSLLKENISSLITKDINIKKSKLSKILNKGVRSIAKRWDKEIRKARKKIKKSPALKKENQNGKNTAALILKTPKKIAIKKKPAKTSSVRGSKTHTKVTPTAK